MTMIRRDADDLDRLHELQQSLVTAQENEQSALRLLSAFSQSGRIDRHKFDSLMAETTKAHAVTAQIFQDWKALADRLFGGVK